MSERLRIKFLIAIWGARYVHEFARVSLPSYLAPGNIPHLAANADLEILVMTTAESISAFDDDPAFARLRSICPVRFILIDDLVTAGQYGVTLTLAFARGIRDSGEQQTSTHFVFMNSDFVLSAGSLASMLKKLEAGSRCIVAPSLRARSEDVLGVLESRVDEEGVLSMPSRELVGLTLRSLHPTVIGKTVTQQLCTCRTHNQVYWQVDESTLLGRYHLIFMLAIKPEVPMGAVNSYCDYGFIPELVPSGDFTVMDDSDDFFMLELQAAAQEKNQLRGGYSSIEEIADQLAEWTTAEHRRFARVDVVFHAKDKPANLAAARAEFTAWFDRLSARLKGAPMTHAGHYYWTMGLQAWAIAKFGKARRVLPPELRADSIASGQHDGQLAYPLRPERQSEPTALQRLHINAIKWVKQLLGSMPVVPIWSHEWRDGRLVLDWVKGVTRRRGGRHLFVASPDSPLVRFFSRRSEFDVSEQLTAYLGDRSGEDDEPAPPGNAYDSILLHVYRADVRQSARAFERLRPVLAPTGQMALFVHHRRGEFDPSNFSYELAQYAEDVLPPDWLGYEIEARFVGGRLKRWLRLVEVELFGYLVPSSRIRPLRMAAGVLLWPFVAAIMAVYNAINREALEECPDYCSSFLLTFNPRPAGEKRPDEERPATAANPEFAG